MNIENLERYERQIIMPEIGEAGQQKLLNSRVLIVGAGGLGCPAALYLAGAGIGVIGIVDADEVSISNLQRQILHTVERVGENKAESAKKSILQLNNSIEVNTYPFYLTPENASDIISKYDFVVDAVDNFETKFLINDTCVLMKKPFCHGGIMRYQGQVMTYMPDKGPCYRCVFEEVPPKGSIPNCTQTGVIGIMAGMIGLVQAMETMKYILGIGELLTGKMYVLDGLTMKSRFAKFPAASKECRVCGPNHII